MLATKCYEAIRPIFEIVRLVSAPDTIDVDVAIMLSLILLLFSINPTNKFHNKLRLKECLIIMSKLRRIGNQSH